jgi:hypothetical protein
MLQAEEAITAIKQALAAPVQEQMDWEAVAADQAMTIAMMKVDQDKSESAYQRGYMDGMAKRREWVSLSDEDIIPLCSQAWVFTTVKQWAEIIEAKLKEKNT